MRGGFSGGFSWIPVQPWNSKYAMF